MRPSPPTCRPAWWWCRDDREAERATRLASSSKTYGAGGVRRQRERDFGRVFTGLLFALFVATLLMAILAGTDVYRGLNREGDAADNQRLSLTLLANDVRPTTKLMLWPAPG